ncbi:DUF600 family protein [Bacillus salacetis]|uniref:DUF600 family protein n=1 Tax=Bacillus salacetis TaxID=2315464 RepID=A0A3A1QPB9_9BACI|nr:immunity protein YezG family protein [Bacillus salacetis]RIW28908.1 DUF600 family protein [Bacillus salacetis]
MNTFEDRFSELQVDMIDICMEYIEDKADKVYVYASCEESIISSKFFYLINNKYVKPHKVNDALANGAERYNVSSERQFMVLEVLNEDIEKVKELCMDYEKDMPTEMKLTYDVKNNKLKAEYKYDLLYTNHETKTARQIADEWFEEVQNNKL